MRDVLSGKRTTANAAWWGFDQQDATEGLQAAIHSGAKTVIMPNNRPAVTVRSPLAIGDVTGTIRVKKPHGTKTNLGERHDSVTLIVRQCGGSERP